MEERDNWEKSGNCRITYKWCKSETIREIQNRKDKTSEKVTNINILLISV